MATGTPRTTSGPPFPIKKLTTQPWREQALTRIGEQRFLLDWMSSQPESEKRITADLRRTIHDHWEAAARAANRHSWRGASVERVTSHLNAVEGDLLRVAPDSYLYGQLPGLLERARKCMAKDDLRRIRLQEIVDKRETELDERDRDLIVAAQQEAAVEARNEVTRLRSFKRVLYITAAGLAIGVIAIAAFAFIWPDKVPMCFSPDGSIVCTTSTTPIPGADPTGATAGQPSTVSASTIDKAMRGAASGWDIAVVLGVGLIAAAVAAAASLRSIRGTSTPFSLPVALALLKLPTGAMTAMLGLVLMRGEFIPGLSALDTPGQILSWAVVLGYSQQLLTRFVDQRAQTVLDDVGRTAPDRAQPDATAEAAPATG